MKMVKGTLQPTLEAQITKTGTIPITKFILKGEVGTNEPFSLSHTVKNLVVTYKHRQVTFNIKEMVKEAVKLVEEVKE